MRAYLINSSGGHGKAAMSSAGDLRTQEREQLKLALVTFALQLDAFEAEAKAALEPISRVTDRLARPRPRKDPRIVGQ